MLRHLILSILLVSLLSPAILMAQTTKPNRGQLLYDNHCLECHVTEVHFREKRKVQNREELLEAIVRWVDELKLEWTADEIADVFEYLNLKYYQFPPAGPL
jgi:mono/diheme cytochrome c family protein